MYHLPKWIITNKFPAFFDYESATAIEQTAKLYGAMRSFISEYDKYIDNLNESIEAFESGQIKSYEEFKVAMSQQFEDFIGVVELMLNGQDKEIADFKQTITNNFNTFVTNIDNSFDSFKNEVNVLIDEQNSVISLYKEEMLSQYNSFITQINNAFSEYKTSIENTFNEFRNEITTQYAELLARIEALEKNVDVEEDYPDDNFVYDFPEDEIEYTHTYKLHTYGVKYATTTEFNCYDVLQGTSEIVLYWRNNALECMSLNPFKFSQNFILGGAITTKIENCLPLSTENDSLGNAVNFYTATGISFANTSKQNVAYSNMKIFDTKKQAIDYLSYGALVGVWQPLNDCEYCLHTKSDTGYSESYKHKNGMLLTNIRKKISVNCTTSEGSLFKGVISAITYPTEFLEIPNVQYSIESTNSLLHGSMGTGSKTTSPTINIIAGSSSTVEVTLNMLIIGRWKE